MSTEVVSCISCGNNIPKSAQFCQICGGANPGWIPPEDAGHAKSAETTPPEPVEPEPGSIEQYLLELFGNAGTSNAPDTAPTETPVEPVASLSFEDLWGETPPAQGSTIEEPSIQASANVEPRAEESVAPPALFAQEPALREPVVAGTPLDLPAVVEPPVMEQVVGSPAVTEPVSEASVGQSPAVVEPLAPILGGESAAESPALAVTQNLPPPVLRWKPLGADIMGIGPAVIAPEPTPVYEMPDIDDKSDPEELDAAPITPVTTDGQANDVQTPGEEHSVGATAYEVAQAEPTAPDGAPQVADEPVNLWAEQLQDVQPVLPEQAVSDAPPTEEDATLEALLADEQSSTRADESLVGEEARTALSESDTYVYGPSGAQELPEAVSDAQAEPPLATDIVQDMATSTHGIVEQEPDSSASAQQPDTLAEGISLVEITRQVDEEVEQAQATEEAVSHIQESPDADPASAIETPPPLWIADPGVAEAEAISSPAVLEAEADSDPIVGGTESGVVGDVETDASPIVAEAESVSEPGVVETVAALAPIAEETPADASPTADEVESSPEAFDVVMPAEPMVADDEAQVAESFSPFEAQFETAPFQPDTSEAVSPEAASPVPQDAQEFDLLSLLNQIEIVEPIEPSGDQTVPLHSIYEDEGTSQSGPEPAADYPVEQQTVGPGEANEQTVDLMASPMLPENGSELEATEAAVSVDTHGGGNTQSAQQVIAPVEEDSLPTWRPSEDDDKSLPAWQPGSSTDKGASAWPKAEENQWGTPQAPQFEPYSPSESSQPHTDYSGTQAAGRAWSAEPSYIDPNMPRPKPGTPEYEEMVRRALEAQHQGQGMSSSPAGQSAFSVPVPPPQLSNTYSAPDGPRPQPGTPEYEAMARQAMNQRLQTTGPLTTGPLGSPPAPPSDQASGQRSQASPSGPDAPRPKPGTPEYEEMVKRALEEMRRKREEGRS